MCVIYNECLLFITHSHIQQAVPQATTLSSLSGSTDQCYLNKRLREANKESDIFAWVKFKGLRCVCVCVLKECRMKNYNVHKSN